MRPPGLQLTAGFNSRTDLWHDELTTWAAGPTVRRLACNQAIGVRLPGGPLMRAHGPTGRHRPGVAEIRVRFPVGPLTTWKVAGYGLPGHGANVVLPRGDEGSTPLPSALTPVVKRTSCLTSNETFRVRLLVGVLRSERIVPSFSGQDSPLTWGRSVVRVHPGRLHGRATRFGDGSRLEGGRALIRPCGFDSRSFR